MNIPSTDPGSANAIKLSMNEFFILIDHSIYTDLQPSDRANILIDFELMDAYYEDNNLNKYIIDPNPGYFESMKLKQGNNIVSTENTSAVIWRKRFWTL